MEGPAVSRQSISCHRPARSDIRFTVLSPSAKTRGSKRHCRAFPQGLCRQKATTACLECHEARIILQQRLSKAAWAKEVDKMTKWGAVVDPADRDALIDYLSTNFSPDKPAYEPRRTSAGKSNSANSSK